MSITAAADGSALGNPGPSGWGWYIDEERWACGGWKRGTNNQGELTAVLDLLRQTAHTGETLHVLCDSQYVINSITKWMAGWKRKGWKKADGKPVLNVEIMKALDAAMAGRDVTFEWVKGHAGHALNEKADQLANSAAKAFSSGRGDGLDTGPGFPGAMAVGAGPDPAAPPAAPGASAPGGSSGNGGAEPDLFSVDAEETAPAGEAATDADIVAGLERSLLTEEVGGDRARLETMLAPEWSHVTARGETRTRTDRLDAPWTPRSASLDVLEVRAVGPDTMLVVARETSADGSYLRSSVWSGAGGRWRQAFSHDTAEGQAG